MSRIEPGIPDMVVLTSEEMRVSSDGRKHLMNEYVVPPATVEQFRQGYRCMECLAVQSQPFPEVCEEVYKDGGGCGYRMREWQPERFESEFGGERELFPDTDPVDVEREFWTPKTSRIVVPRNAKL